MVYGTRPNNNAISSEPETRLSQFNMDMETLSLIDVRDMCAVQVRNDQFIKPYHLIPREVNDRFIKPYHLIPREVSV